ncbi:hypothetical protein GCM10010425_22660 [Streptomyces spororaveus]|uniref:nSTAND1 domain-containing NTPase n=1 Tax=Streptomyces spororaveus TaxID=284039 RepID=UPI0031D46963
MNGPGPTGLPASVAQVLDPSGTVAGAGFLVADDILVTCAHVVEAAGGGPGGSLQLSFPHLEGAPRTQGLVLEAAWRAPDTEDVAFVRLSSPPAGATTLPLGSAAGLRGHQVRSFGFPAQAPPDGHFGFGVAGDLLPATERRSAHLQLTAANDLTTGFSGGPVLDEVTGLVIGMLTEITEPDEQERGQGIAYVTPTQVLREIRPELAEREVCPYRGLEPFTAEHTQWFEGRKDAVRQVLTNLAQQRGITLLLGPSGSGKSSLVQAGVLPALAAGELPGSDSWLPVLTRPRQDLLSEIERAGLPGADSDGIAAAVARRLSAEPTSQRIVLIIDQFEELFTQPSGGRGQKRSLAAMEQIVAAFTSHAALSVILIMRDDFYPQLASLTPKLLGTALPGLLNMSGTLSREDLNDIIALPAQSVGLRFEHGLPEQMITDVLAATPEEAVTRRAPVTVLPLLELALSQLWQRRRDGFLTHDAYRRIGGVTGSLTVWCDTAVAQLPAAQRPVAQRILTSLVRPADPSRNIPAVRAQIPLGELRELAAGPDDAPDAPGGWSAVDEVIASLTRHRIITTYTPRTSPDGSDGAPGEPGQPAAELIHDALIRDWATLRQWVGQDHRFQEWLEHTRTRRARWADAKDPGDLLAGSALAEGQEWSQQRPLPREIAAFVTASAERQQATIRRSRRLNMILATLLALALVAAGGVLWQWRTAVAARASAQSRQLAAQSGTLISSNPELASLLAVQAYRTSHTSEATESLQNAAALPLNRQLSGHEGNVLSVAFSPDGTVASGSQDATVRLWDAAAGRSRMTLDEEDAAVISVAFSPDGHTLASGRSDGAVKLWDVATGKPRTTLPGPGDQVNAVVFSRDGSLIAAGDYDGKVRLWDAAAGTARATLDGHTDPVKTLAFSPDGRTLATGGDDLTVRLWDVPTGKLRTALPELLSVVQSVSFSPDGRTLAVASGDGTVGLWNVATGKPGTTLDMNAASVAFSPDGRTLAAGSSDHSVQLWDVATGAARANLIGHTDEVKSVAFSPDGRTLASAGYDRSVRLWEVTGRTTLTGHTTGVLAATFSRDGHTLATGGGDGTVVLWDVAGGKPRSTIKQDSGVLSVAFAPDGRTLVTGALDQFARVWDVAARKVVSTLDTHAEKVVAVAFSPDGHTLATGGSDGVVWLWEAASGAPRTSLDGHTDAVTSLAFSPDGDTLATSGVDHTVLLWDLASGKLATTLGEHTDRVQSVAFSPDGDTLATGGYDRTVRLWDLASGKTRTTLIGHTAGVDSLAFSPDGRTLGTGGEDLTVRLWDTASGKARATLIGHSDVVSSVTFHPDGRTLASGSYDKTVRLWNLALPQPAAAVKKICRTVNRDLTREERTAYLPGQSVGTVCSAH